MKNLFKIVHDLKENLVQLNPLSGHLNQVDAKNTKKSHLKLVKNLGPEVSGSNIDLSSEQLSLNKASKEQIVESNKKEHQAQELSFEIMQKKEHKSFFVSIVLISVLSIFFAACGLTIDKYFSQVFKSEHLLRFLCLLFIFTVHLFLVTLISLGVDSSRYKINRDLVNGISVFLISKLVFSVLFGSLFDLNAFSNSDLKNENAYFYKDIIDGLFLTAFGYGILFFKKNLEYYLGGYDGFLHRELESRQKLLQTEQEKLSELVDKIKEFNENHPIRTNQVEIKWDTIERNAKDGGANSVLAASILGKTADLLRQSNEQVLVMVNAANQVGVHLAELATITDEIKEISLQSKVMSLNTSIEAAHVGETGKTFNIIAIRMQELSDKVEVLTQSIDLKLVEVHIQTKNAFELSEKVEIIFSQISEELNQFRLLMLRIEELSIRQTVSLSEIKRIIFSNEINFKKSLNRELEKNIEKFKHG